jgi:vacuolar-type H+-ATPase subunit E/Vma4
MNISPQQLEIALREALVEAHMEIETRKQKIRSEADSAWRDSIRRADEECLQRLTDGVELRKREYAITKAARLAQSQYYPSTWFWMWYYSE